MVLDIQRKGLMVKPTQQGPRRHVYDPGAAWPEGLEAAALAALPDFLLRQRWYPAKDASRPAVARSTLMPFPVPSIHQ